MTKPLRVGVISANWGMVAHLPAWHAIDGVEVHAVCTSRRETAEAARERFGLRKCYWNHADMAADPDIDIVDVGTRPDLRRDMVLEAIGNGKHVFAAANFAATIDAARDMRDAAREAGITGALDSTLAYAPAHRRMAQLIADGWIGRPSAVTTRLWIPLFGAPDGIGSRWRWFAKRSHGASAMRNLGTHSLHLLVSLLGPIESVTALAHTALEVWKFSDGEVIHPETEDTAQIMLRFASGVTGQISVGWSSPALTGWRMELNGDKGTLISEHDGTFPSGPEVRLHGAQNGARPAELDLPEVCLSPPEFSFAAPPLVPQSHDIAGVMASFIRAIREGSRPSPDFEQAWHVEAALEAARLAILQRRWVDIAEIDPEAAS